MVLQPPIPLNTIPIAKRPPGSWSGLIKAALFFVIFLTGCIIINSFQFVFLFPLLFLPFKSSERLYNSGIRYTKGAFGCLQILMCEWFAPTKLIITFETKGKGAFSQYEIDRYIIKDDNDNPIALDLPTKFVLIANHQIYADWWYAWCFTYFMSPHGVHRYVYITLKKSLRWVPFIGWGMQFFKFIFLARSWASDRKQLSISLASLGREAESENTPLCFLVYPEGTLVSKGTRPTSKKFADKMGISDMRNMLLPRSTGLHYSLRSLAPKIPGLRLLDVTMAYPGIPKLGYGQDYFTLRSIFFDGIPPPAIHLHLRIFDVPTTTATMNGNMNGITGFQTVPIGDLTAASGAAPPDPQAKRTVEVDIPPNEKEIFDTWLWELWESKDEDMERFLDTGSFKIKEADMTPVVKIPIELKHRSEILDAFCFFLPAGIAYLWRRLRGRG